mmetsp:Transcript_7260/g.12287  ORF Transcript_7260/g.12287 Transcript_7260/m.12287 type:complete len:269 (+) Transcript_7260:17-823(+)
MSPKRVLVVYGSETGNALRGIMKCIRYWKAECDGSYIIDGNALAGNDVQSLTKLRDEYDVLIVSTSSFGEGDPPANYVHFMLKLVRAASDVSQGGAPPLKGMQHAVLGYGQSVFQTFQNTPRWTDKLLEQLGSRRCVQRVELDEGPDEDPTAEDDEAEYFGSGGSSQTLPDAPTLKIRGRDVGIRHFQLEVAQALLQAARNVGEPPVCRWDVPGGIIWEKSEDELLAARPEVITDHNGRLRASLATAAIMATAALAGAISFFYATKMQ